MIRFRACLKGISKTEIIYSCGCLEVCGTIHERYFILRSNHLNVRAWNEFWKRVYGFAGEVTVDRFLNRTDKLGNDLFINDIIRVNLNKNLNELAAAISGIAAALENKKNVGWIEEIFGIPHFVSREAFTDPIQLNLIPEIEKLGNIHENSYLLEVNDDVGKTEKTSEDPATDPT